MLVYCGQMVGRIKMKLGMEVGLGLCQIVFNGDPAPLVQRGTAPQIFGHVVAKRPCLLWLNGWMDQDASLVRR